MQHAQVEVTSFPKSWPDTASSKTHRLRRFLEERMGHWCHMQELQSIAGWRYGARLEEVRKGRDGKRPLVVEKRSLAANVWEYRAVEHADAEPTVRVPRPTMVEEERLKELCLNFAKLQVENQRLKARIAELERTAP